MRNRHNKRSFAKLRKERQDLQDLLEETRGVKRRSRASFEVQTPSSMAFEHWQEEIENKIEQIIAKGEILETVYDNETQTDGAPNEEEKQARADPAEQIVAKTTSESQTVSVVTYEIGIQKDPEQNVGALAPIQNTFPSIFASGIGNRLQFGRPVIPVNKNKPFDLSKPLLVELRNHKWYFENRKVWTDEGTAKVLIDIHRLSDYSLASYAVMHIIVKDGDNVIAAQDCSISGTAEVQTMEINCYDGFEHHDDAVSIHAWFEINYPNVIKNEFGTEIKFADASRSHDVIISIGCQKFYLHKIYLAYWSKEFDGMFSNSSYSDEIEEYPIFDVKPEEFFMLMELIHPNRLRPIDDSNVLFLFELAHRFQMPSVLSMCGEYLCNLENKKDMDVIERLKLADKHKLEDLMIVSLNAIRTKHNYGAFVAANIDRLEDLTATTMKNLCK